MRGIFSFNFLLQLLSAIMILGYAACIIRAAQQKQFSILPKLILIPFYVFYYVLNLPPPHASPAAASGTHSETDPADVPLAKKLLAISTMGAFMLFILIFILRTVMSPPA